MQRTISLLLLTWILTLGGAFFIGKSTHPSTTGQDSELLRPESRTRPSSPRRSPRTDRHASGQTSLPLLSDNTRVTDILVRRPPRQAVVELARLVDPVERAKGFLALVSSLEDDDFEGVVADFRALGMTDQRMSEYAILLHAWGKVNPGRALEYAMEHTGTAFAKQAILASWAAEAPEAALEFARSNHEGDAANPFLLGVIRGVAPQDLGRATDLLQELPYGDERGKALRAMLPYVMETGVDGAINWTANLADDRLRSGALTFILSDVSKSEPEKAATLMAGLKDRETAKRVADDIGASLARRDLDRAISWSEALQPDIRSEAVEGVISLYASQDAEAASRWLESLSEETNLDAAIRRFAWNTQSREPELAANWVHRMTDERRRNEMYYGVLSQWLRSNASAARAWIDNTPGLPERVTALPERLDRRSRGLGGGR